MKIKLDENHQYWVNKKPKKGVNQIMEEVGFKKPLPDFEVIKEAARIGTEVHKTIELLIHDLNPDALDEYRGEHKEAVRNLSKALEDYSLVPVDAEKMIYSKNYNCCGTIDIVCGWEHDPNLKHDPVDVIIVDIKHKAKLSRNDYVQVAMYCKMYGVKKGLVISTKTGESGWIFDGHLKLAEKIFQAHLNNEMFQVDTIDNSLEREYIRITEQIDLLKEQKEALRLQIWQESGGMNVEGTGITGYVVQGKTSKRIDNKKLLEIAKNHLDEEILKEAYKEVTTENSFRIRLKGVDENV
jgi:hypothetical protein